LAPLTRLRKSFPGIQVIVVKIKSLTTSIFKNKWQENNKSAELVCLSLLFFKHPINSRYAGGQAGRRAGGQGGRRAGEQAGRGAGGQALLSRVRFPPILQTSK
jgi:hypothetical protein